MTAGRTARVRDVRPAVCAVWRKILFRDSPELLYRLNKGGRLSSACAVLYADNSSIFGESPNIELFCLYKAPNYKVIRLIYTISLDI